MTVLLSVFLMISAGLEKETSSPEPAATVEMTNTLKFIPKSVIIEAGETVLWKNTSMIVHTVTCDASEATMERSVRLPEGAQPFDSGRLQSDAEFRHTFEVKGTYKYFCKPHEGANMVGIVEVK